MYLCICNIYIYIPFIFARFKPEDFDGILLAEYVSTITRLMLHGPDCLYKGGAQASMLATHGTVKEGETESRRKEKELTEPLQKASLALLCSLASQTLYVDIVKEHCILKILEGSESIESQALELLSVIIRRSSGVTLVSIFAPVLRSRLFESLTFVQSNYHAHGTDTSASASLTAVPVHLRRIAQSLSALNSLFDQEPRIGNIYNSSRYFYLQNLFETTYLEEETLTKMEGGRRERKIEDNETKAMYLSGTADSTTLSIINNILRYITL